MDALLMSINDRLGAMLPEEKKNVGAYVPPLLPGWKIDLYHAILMQNRDPDAEDEE